MARVAVETVFGSVVADSANRVSRDGLNIHVAISCDFAHNEYQTRGSGSFAGNPRVRVFRENGVKYRIRNLVADFIGMPFGYAFAGEKFVHKKSFFIRGKDLWSPRASP